MLALLRADNNATATDEVGAHTCAHTYTRADDNRAMARSGGAHVRRAPGCQMPRSSGCGGAGVGLWWEDLPPGRFAPAPPWRPALENTTSEVEQRKGYQEESCARQGLASMSSLGKARKGCACRWAANACDPGAHPSPTTPSRRTPSYIHQHKRRAGKDCSCGRQMSLSAQYGPKHYDGLLCKQSHKSDTAGANAPRHIVNVPARCTSASKLLDGLPHVVWSPLKNYTNPRATTSRCASDAHNMGLGSETISAGRCPRTR